MGKFIVILKLIPQTFNNGLIHVFVFTHKLTSVSQKEQKENKQIYISHLRLIHLHDLYLAHSFNVADIQQEHVYRRQPHKGRSIMGG